MEFYSRALGAVELYRSPLPGGMGLHLHVRIGKTFVMITEEAPPSQARTINDTIALRSPQSLGGTTAVFEILVDDVDAAYQKAVDAGALRAHLGFGDSGGGIDARRSKKTDGPDDGENG